MKQAVTLSPRAALHWGNAALVAALVGSVGVLGIVIVRAPGLTPLLPVVLVAACAGAYLFTMPRLNFIAWLGGLVFLFSNEGGIQMHEALYGLYFYAYLGHWYVRRLFLYRQPLIRVPIDVAVGLWLVLGLGLGIALGMLFGGEPVRIRGEVIGFTLLAIYFPVKEFCVRDKHGPAIVLAIMAWIGIWVTVDNALIARQTFAEATMLWEIADVRTSGRELLLTFPGVILLALLPTLARRTHQAMLVGVLVALLIGLILTKSRIFWVEYLVAVAVLIAISPGLEKRRLITWCVAGATLLVLFGMLFLSSYFNLLVTGISSRFATIGSATTDISLVNRLVETEAVWKQVTNNPVLGYGFGRTYSFYDLTSLGTLSRSYSHVGIVAVLYKFGLWGGAIVGYTWLASMYTVFRDSRRRIISSFDRATLRGIFACSFSMILPAITTSVFFEDEKLAAFILITALGVSLHCRAKIGRALGGSTAASR